MRPFDAAELFFYGIIRSLTYLQVGHPLAEYKTHLTDVASDLDHFILIHKRRAVVRREARNELRNAIKAAESLHSFIRGTLYPIGRDLLNETHVELLNEYIKEFETALKLDLGALPIYVLEDKRGYSARSFLAGARIVLSDSDQKILPELCLSDIDEAGKCLLHEQFTACGFHVLRAVEAVARPFYKLITGKTPENKNGLFLGLGTLIYALKNKTDSDLLSHLTRIKKHRDAIMHPEKTLDENAATEIFDSAKLAISQIARETSARGGTLI